MYVLTQLFSYNVTPTTQIYTLSLHDALPISLENRGRQMERVREGPHGGRAVHRLGVRALVGGVPRRVSGGLRDHPLLQGSAFLRGVDPPGGRGGGGVGKRGGGAAVGGQVVCSPVL